MKVTVIAIFIVTSIAACSSSKVVDTSKIERLYGDRNRSALEAEIGQLSVEERAVVLEEVAGLRLSNYIAYRDANELAKLRKLLDATAKDPVVASDPFSMKQVLIYRSLSDEAEGRNGDWHSVCLAANKISNECQCRYVTILENLPRIDDRLNLAKVDQVNWIAKSGVSACQDSSWFFSTVSAVLANEVAVEPVANTKSILKENLQRNEERVNFWLCASRRHYLSYSNSRLYELERAGVFSCPSPVV